MLQSSKNGDCSWLLNNLEIPCLGRQQIKGYKKNGFYEMTTNLCPGKLIITNKFEWHIYFSSFFSMTVSNFFKTYGRDPERAFDSVIPASLLEEQDYGRLDQLYWDNIKNSYQPVYDVYIPHSLMDHHIHTYIHSSLFVNCTIYSIYSVLFFHFIFLQESEGAKADFLCFQRIGSSQSKSYHIIT